MEKGVDIACQLTYIPLGAENVQTEVEEVLNIIKSYFPNSKIGEMSTVIKGKSTLVFKMLDDIAKTMNKKGNKFNIQTNLSNICGCSIS